jgi:hypothetical protein
MSIRFTPRLNGDDCVVETLHARFPRRGPLSLSASPPVVREANARVL